MRMQPPTVARTRSSLIVRSAAVAAAVVLAGQSHALAADVFWGNEALTGVWSTTDGNFEGAPWNNAAGNGAIFDALAPTAVTVPADVNAASVSVTVNGYSFSGAGAINLVPGTSTLSPSGQTQRIFSVGNPTWTAGDTIPSVTVSNAINTTGAFQKQGTGILNHTGGGTITGTVDITATGNLKANVVLGSPTSGVRGGVLKYNPGGLVNATTKLGIGNGFLDIGANDVTIAELTYANATSSTPFDALYPGYNANNGVVGTTGKLRVLGEINVIGWISGGPGNFGNYIGAKLDLGGGTQIVRPGLVNSFMLESALMFTGEISNGSLFKSAGYTQAGAIGNADGIGLLANNTYTGSTILNGGTSALYGTNATSLIKLHAGGLSMRGVNGSAQSAATIQIFSGSTLTLDNTGFFGGGNLNSFTATLSPNGPQAAGGVNNDRVRDDAEIQLRDSTLRVIGAAATATTETVGKLNVLAGHNNLFLTSARTNATPSVVTGTTAITAGELVMSPRSTLQIQRSVFTFSSTLAPVLGVDQQVFVTGALPTADATGILPRIVTITTSPASGDFVTYSPVTGITPFTGYVNNLTTAGANVDLNTAAGAITVSSSIAVNAIKSTATAATTTTIAAGQTLTVTSGMLLNAASGARTYAGPGTLDFGANPGVLFNSSGNTTITAPITGSAGLIHAVGTARVENLAGLTGRIDIYGGTFNHGNTGAFVGDIHVRSGSYTMVQSASPTSTTGWGTGTIYLGNPDNEANMFGGAVTMSTGSGATMANTVIERNIVVNNGTTNIAGLALPEGFMPTISPLSNSTGSQTFSGNVTLLTSLNLQGGGATGTVQGSSIFTGDISGPGVFRLTNGRANFRGNVSNAGGFNMGRGGNTTDAIFEGTVTGVAPITLQGGNNSLLRYKGDSLPKGTISIIFGTYAAPPTVNTSFSFIPLDDVPISNPIVLAGGDITFRPGAGITGTLAGPITGPGQIVFNGAGTMLLTDPVQAQTGPLILAVAFPVTTPVTAPGTLGIRSRRTHQGNTTLAAGTTLRLGAGTTGPDVTGTSVFNDTTSVLTIAGGATPTATLDIGHQAVIFDYATTSPESTLKAQIIAGRNAGTWTGIGITSSAAAASPAAYAVGYADATEAAPGLAGVLMGQSFDSTSVLVRYTRAGDANLDGTVNFDDLLVLAANYNQSTTKWSAGDFDYSGNVNFDDLLILAANYNQSLPGSLGGDWALALSSVPEPTSMLVLAAAAGGTLGRRRRRGIR